MLPLGVHGGMHIPVQGNLHVRMAQNLAEALYIRASFDTVGGKGVTENMEVPFRKACRLKGERRPPAPPAARPL